MKSRDLREGMQVASICSGCDRIHIKEDFTPHSEVSKNTVGAVEIPKVKYIRFFSFCFSSGDSYERYRDEVISSAN